MRTFISSSALAAGSAAARSGVAFELDRVRLADQALEGPVAALDDLARDPGQRGDGAERPAATRELERGDVVLLAVVVAGEGGGPEEVHGPVGADETAAGEGRGGGQEESQQRGRDEDAETSHRSVSWSGGPARVRDAAQDAGPRPRFPGPCATGV